MTRWQLVLALSVRGALVALAAAAGAYFPPLLWEKLVLAFLGAFLCTIAQIAIDIAFAEAGDAIDRSRESTIVRLKRRLLHIKRTEP